MYYAPHDGVRLLNEGRIPASHSMWHCVVRLHASDANGHPAHIHELAPSWRLRRRIVWLTEQGRTTEASVGRETILGRPSTTLAFPVAQEMNIAPSPAQAHIVSRKTLDRVAQHVGL